MSAERADLTPWARSGLILLCILVVASVAVRLSACRQQSVSGTAIEDAADAAADLGGGILLPGSANQHRAMQVAACPAPVSVIFVSANPYGSDPSLVGAPQLGDRVVYIYRGWNLGSRYATIVLNMIHFARRAYDRLAMRKISASDDLAVKLIIPSGCGASPDVIMAGLRRAARS